MFTGKEIQSFEQLRRAIQIVAGAIPTAQAREVASIYPAWAPGTHYPADVYLTHGTDPNGDPILYITAQEHDSQEDWPPEKVPALYTRISLDSSGHPIWSAPTGAHDAYDKGDVVSHKDKLWRSKRDGNTSEPGTDEWWEIYEEV